MKSWPWDDAQGGPKQRKVEWTLMAPRISAGRGLGDPYLGCLSEWAEPVP